MPHKGINASYFSVSQLYSFWCLYLPISTDFDLVFGMEMLLCLYFQIIFILSAGEKR
jgi:hypothetical protein